jgi:hypothetical protein
MHSHQRHHRRQMKRCMLLTILTTTLLSTMLTLTLTLASIHIISMRVALFGGNDGILISLTFGITIWTLSLTPIAIALPSLPLDPLSLASQQSGTGSASSSTESLFRSPSSIISDLLNGNFEASTPTTTITTDNDDTSTTGGYHQPILLSANMALFSGIIHFT